jgi:GR25 family glycosyltransferase involved in LPS biosynthesis
LKTYLIYSKSENDRQTNVAQLRSLLPNLNLFEAVYPAQHKVPFLNKAMEISKQRAGQALLPGEIGCLLSHRAIWHQIADVDSNEKTHFMVLESDSCLKNIELFMNLDKQLVECYDLFFWGAWDGHMQLFRKKRIKLEDGYQIGTPFIKSIYCTYGYSLNKKTAKFLLKQTGKFSYPVDQYKRFMTQGDIKIGGIVPELISTTGTASSIRSKQNSEILNQLYLMVLDIKNYLICFFK